MLKAILAIVTVLRPMMRPGDQNAPPLDPRPHDRLNGQPDAAYSVARRALDGVDLPMIL